MTASGVVNKQASEIEAERNSNTEDFQSGGSVNVWPYARHRSGNDDPPSTIRNLKHLISAYVQEQDTLTSTSL